MSTNQKLTNLVLLYSAMLLSIATARSVNACEAKLQSIDLISSNARAYDVFSSEAYGLTQQYEVKTLFSPDSNPENCMFYVKVSTFDLSKRMTSLQNQSLTFEPFPQSAFSGVQHNYWYGQITPLNTKFRFQLRFPGKQFAPKGDYSALLEAQLMQNKSLINVLDEINQTATIKIDSAAKISFYGLADNLYKLNLGELTTGKVIDLSPNLYVKSTSGYSLSFDSTNKGHLRHQNQLAKWDINYQLTLNNIDIDLTQSSAQFYSSHSTSYNGDRMPLKIIVGNTEKKPGGRYTDEVHIYVTPSEMINQ